MGYASTGISAVIDKLTNSIENSISGDSFKTEVLLVSAAELKKLKKADWTFDWKREGLDENKRIYKLVIRDNPFIIQGLVSVEDKGDHIFMHLIESARFNKGARK